MHYEPDYPENVKEHKIYHDKIVNGIYARRIKSDKIAWENSDYRITVVNYYSPSTQKKRADKAGRAAHEDTPFDFAPYDWNEPLDERNVHIFLLYKKNRIVGFLIVEKRCYTQKYTWEDYKKVAGNELQKRKPIWSIGLVWVHRKHRKRGMGKQLVKVIASFFKIKIQSIGWYSPFTDDGKNLVKSLRPEFFYIAK
tara:strand:+ start:2678 stop:3265 length:588 start_codon:yes stop_codon:yes gene_type:complete